MEIYCKRDKHISDLLLQHVRQGNNTKVLSILNGVDPCQLSDNAGVTLLHYAAKYGNVRLIKYLIDSRANVDIQDNQNKTPLMYAIRNNKHEAVKVLLDANADIYFPNQQGNSSLKVALDSGFEDILRSLIDRVTSESLSNSKYAENLSFSNFPLYYFTLLKDVDVIRTLLEKGCLIDAGKPDTGATSLHMAVNQVDLEKAKLLLEYGANVNAKDSKKRTPLRYLHDFKDENQALSMVQMLLEAGAILIDCHERQMLVSPLLTYAPKKIVRCVLEHKMDLYFEEENGCTPLFYLTQNLNNDVLAELRDFDIDVNFREWITGRTMAHLAVLQGNVSAVLFLLDCNADFNATCILGYTPIHHILVRCSRYPEHLDNYLKCVEVLLARGLDPRIWMEETSEESKIRNFVIFGDDGEDDNDDDDDNSVVSEAFVTIMNPIFAYLSLIEKIEKDYTYKKFLAMPKFEKILKSKVEEREKMEKISLGQSVSLLDFLRVTDQTISLYARNRKLISISNSEMKNYNMDRSYQFKLNDNFLKYSKLVELREKAASTIYVILTEVLNTSIYNVAEKIVEFLDDHEVNLLL